MHANPYGGFLKWWSQQPWVFVLKMIISGCFGGTITLGNTLIPSRWYKSINQVLGFFLGGNSFQRLKQKSVGR